MITKKSGVRMVHSYAEQIRLWVNGESVHSDHRFPQGECCPDFSCCIQEMPLSSFEYRIRVAKESGINIAN